MWSVWSETIEVYLGQGVAMIKAGHKETMVMPHPATLPMARVLAKLTDTVGQHIAKGSKLKISLSGAVCAAFGVAMPDGVTAWQEQQQIALASAAHGMGAQPDQIACAIDAAKPAAVAALPLAILEELKLWAAQLGCNLASVSPLWAIATQCPASRQSTTEGLLLQEPGCMTLLAGKGVGSFNAITLLGEASDSSVQADITQWLHSHALDDRQLVKIRFGSQAAAPDTSKNTAAQPMPRRWAGHWHPT